MKELNEFDLINIEISLRLHITEIKNKNYTKETLERYNETLKKIQNMQN